MNTVKPISIAIATYNGESYLAEQLDSLISQTYMPIEVIICDDASTDNTVRIIESYLKKLPIVLYKNTKREGVVANFRKAISKCTGEWVACCDQDDVWLPEKLQLLSEIMKTIDSPLPAIVYSDLIVTDATLKVISESYWQMRNINPKNEGFYSLLFGNTVTGCTLLINKAMSFELAKMPDSVILHDYWAACIAYSWGRYSFINNKTVLYRQHLSNVTKNDKVNVKSRVINLIKYIRKGADNFLVKELNQAELFYQMYAEKLNEADKSTLLKFLELRNWKTWKRKILAYLIKINL